MAKRDPDNTARNRIIANIRSELRSLLPRVLLETKTDREASLNAKIGSKTDGFIDLKNDVIRSQNEYVNQWLSGFYKELPKGSQSLKWIEQNLKDSKAFKRYLILFLERSYLKHFDELSKKRPKLEHSEIWVGQTNADYGLLVTPRFRGNEWENDKSEIRAFREGYFTIGHVLETGLVVPGEDRKIEFSEVANYLTFFRDVMVRGSGSKHELAIADLYCEYVRSQNNSLSVPLLIPDFAI